MFKLCVVPDKFVCVFLFFLLLWTFVESDTNNNNKYIILFAVFISLKCSETAKHPYRLLIDVVKVVSILEF